MFLYKDVGLDNFEEKNRMKSVYFLSHFHAGAFCFFCHFRVFFKFVLWNFKTFTDHMMGLKAESFKNYLIAKYV